MRRKLLWLVPSFEPLFSLTAVPYHFADFDCIACAVSFLLVETIRCSIIDCRL